MLFSILEILLKIMFLPNVRVFGKIAKQFRSTEWRPSDVNNLVNFCIKVLEYALQSGLTVHSGFLLRNCYLPK